jgi:16S rRNA (cytosine967-C5)-methyltransferase
MPASPARIAAFDILLQVAREDAYASELLHSARYSTLSPTDHGLATELVMGVLRWRSFLDYEIEGRSSTVLAKLDTEVLTSLRLAAYQLSFLDRVPGRAAVNESVELVKRARKRSAVPFVNAVLRKLAAAPPRPSTPPFKTTAELAKATAHPPWLVERWSNQFGLEVAAQICTYDQQVPPTSVTVATPAIQEDLENAGVALAPGHLLASSRRVMSGDLHRLFSHSRNPPTVQDEASQLVALLMGEGGSFLDCCAAPGGKTRSIAQHNPSATILAADLHPHRARLLGELVSANNVHVIAADARNLPTSSLFDGVLADVPCSGTGTLARNPEIKWRLNAEDIADLQSRQVAILQSAMKRVAPGGTLLYSTCSLEPEENQLVVDQALSLDGSFYVADCKERLRQLQASGELVWKHVDSLASGPYLRTIPGVHLCDGFFAALLKKS